MSMIRFYHMIACARKDIVPFSWNSKNNDNWHWVKYTNANEIIVTLNDNTGDLREICTKQGNDSLFCQKYDAFAKEYHFKSNQTIFEIWISKVIDIY
tara:strand:- start:562 stop:852 length:291 start_codon:yes stop_codon:yes gene_type:complete